MPASIKPSTACLLPCYSPEKNKKSEYGTKQSAVFLAPRNLETQLGCTGKGVNLKLEIKLEIVAKCRDTLGLRPSRGLWECKVANVLGVRLQSAALPQVRFH